MVEVHSTTWKAIEAFIEKQREDAVAALIADDRSEQQRGKVLLLDELKKLSAPKSEPLVSDNYQT